ncbi:MAG: hypothetical protein Q8Q09_27600 [Deltaproteobacteria bacterium]|nr:hypothetical protein [Deltaproteobacteria bacterium]
MSESVAIRARLIGDLLDEILDEIESDPATRSLIQVERHRQTRELERRLVLRDARSLVMEALQDYCREFVERAVARDLCTVDWLDNETRLFCNEKCDGCKGLGTVSGDRVCGCASPWPGSLYRLARMLGLPPAKILAQERIDRGRFRDTVGVVYVPSLDGQIRSVSRPGTFGDLKMWVLRQDPAMPGVRWPRLVRSAE